MATIKIPNNENKNEEINVNVEYILPTFQKITNVFIIIACFLSISLNTINIVKTFTNDKTESSQKTSIVKTNEKHQQQQNDEEDAEIEQEQQQEAEQQPRKRQTKLR